MLLKFAMSEDRQVTLQWHKGLVGTKLGLDEDLMSVQEARKLELWPLFKKAKAAGKCVIELFIDGIRICPPSSV
jgi:hypothetical protein